MKAIRLLLVSVFVLCVSTTNVVASEESDAAKIQRAMKAAPSSISAEATILDVSWDPVDGWPVLREGSNGWTCFPGVPLPLDTGDKHPMCNDDVWMRWVDAVVNLFYVVGSEWTFETETVGYSYMLRGDALVNNGIPGAPPSAEGIWDQEGPHLMLLYPDSVDLPLAESPYDGGPYVMWSGWPLEHVMVPLTDRDR